jgi:O-antigen/teichoic acid export membrane protein
LARDLAAGIESALTPGNDSDDVASTSAEQSTEDSPEDIERASIARNVVALLSSQMVTWSLATILAIVQPRFLGPATQGNLRLAFSLWTMASVLIGLGTSVFLTLQVSRDRRSGLDLLGPVLIVRSLAFVGTAVVLAGFVVAVGSDAEFNEIMVLYGVMIFLASMSDAFSSVFLGLERMSVLAKANISARVAGTVVAVIVLVSGGSAVAVVAVGAGSNLVALTILVGALGKITKISFRGWRRKSRMILAGSLGFLAAGIVLSVYQQVDTVVMSLLVDRDALGWYGTADTLFGSLLFLPTIVTASIFPILGRLHQNDPAGIPPLVNRTAATLLLVTVPIGLGTAVVAFPLAPLLYGDDFSETGGVLFVLGPVIILTAGNVLFGGISLATGRQRFWTMYMIAAIALTIPIDLVTVPWADQTYSNGAIGGALAYLITESLLVVIGLVKVAPFMFNRAFAWRTARIGLAGALMFAASWPLRDLVLLVPIAVGAIVYVAAILAFQVLEDQDRRRVGMVLARAGVRTSWAAPASPSSPDVAAESE